MLCYLLESDITADVPNANEFTTGVNLPRAPLTVVQAPTPPSASRARQNLMLNNAYALPSQHQQQQQRESIQRLSVASSAAAAGRRNSSLASQRIENIAHLLPAPNVSPIAVRRKRALSSGSVAPAGAPIVLLNKKSKTRDESSLRPLPALPTTLSRGLTFDAARPSPIYTRYLISLLPNMAL